MLPGMTQEDRSDPKADEASSLSRNEVPILLFTSPHYSVYSPLCIPLLPKIDPPYLLKENCI